MNYILLFIIHVAHICASCRTYERVIVMLTISCHFVKESLSCSQFHAIFNLIYFLMGIFSKELMFLDGTDPGHFPRIPRPSVQFETIHVLCIAEMSDHVSFAIRRVGCVPTLPAQVFHRDGGIIDQLDPYISCESVGLKFS